MPASKDRPDITPARVEKTYRGVTFVLVEQDADTYDEVLTTATSEVYNDATGEKTERVDEALLLRLLLKRALVEPKTISYPLPTRLQRQLTFDVRELHFGVEPPDVPEKKAEPVSIEQDDDLPKADG